MSTAVCAPELIGEEVSEELEYVGLPSSWSAGRCAPSMPVVVVGAPCGLPTTPGWCRKASWAWSCRVLLLARFDDHVAYYTLERIFRERHDVVIPRQQIVQWVEHIAFLLQPLCRQMFERISVAATSRSTKARSKSWIPKSKANAPGAISWFYAVPDGDVFLDYPGTAPGRPAAELTGFAGTIQTDAYEVYDSSRKSFRISNGSGVRPMPDTSSVVRSGRATAGPSRSSPSSADSTGSNAKPGPGLGRRHQVRQEQAPPIWTQLQNDARALQPQLLPKSTLGKAVNYLINEYEALTGYLERGRYKVDNNLVRIRSEFLQSVGDAGSSLGIPTRVCAAR